MDIMSGLNALNSALSAIKAVRDIEKGVDEATFKVTIAEAYQNLADVKMALVEAHDERETLNREIERLKKNWSFSSELVECQGFKFRQNADGQPIGEAFCSVCETNDNEYFHVTPSKGLIEFTCPNCKTIFYQPPSFPWPVN